MCVCFYAIQYGGVRCVSSGATIGGGNTLLLTEQHALDGAEHTAATLTDRLLATITHSGLLPPLSGDANDALRGDLTWGAVVGAGETPIDHGSMGATETIDISAG